MRIKHRRSLFGYSSKAVEKAVDSMREAFEAEKLQLEAELNELNQAADRMLEEIHSRKGQLDNSPATAKEPSELCLEKSSNVEVEEELPMMLPRLVFSGKKIN